MVEELKLAIKIDDATVEQSLLKQFANAQKMADKVVLDFKNVNFDDKQVEAKFKEMQKKAGQNPIDLSISGNTLDMLGQIDKRLTEILSIGKGKSFIDSSSTVADIGKIENKINELNKKYEEAQKKLLSIGSGNISGKDVNLVDNKEFQKLSQEVSELKNQFDDLKTHMQLLDDYTVPTDRFFELQSQVETTTVKVSDLVEEFTKLSNAQKALSSTPQESNISSASTPLINDQNNYQKELSETKKLTDDNVSSMFEFIKLCQEQAKALGETNEELKERAAYFKDEKISGRVSVGTHYAGNHDNSDINGANSDLHSHFSKYASFSENDLFNLKDTIKNFMVMGTDELTHFDTSGLSKDLLEQIWLRYDAAIKELNQQYFDNLNIKNNLKFTDIEDIPERILDKAFEFAENQSNIDYDYDKYDVFYNNQIEKIRQKLLEGASLNDITNSISDDIKSFDINGVESEIKTFQEKFTEGIRGYLTNILLENDVFNPDKLLGMQDYNIARNNSLKSVLDELNVGSDRLKTIDISNLEKGYSSLLKILGLVVDKQKEIASTDSTDQRKDAFHSDIDTSSSVKSLENLEEEIKKIFTDANELQNILDSLHNGKYFHLSWTTDGIDETGADERVRQLSKLLKEYGYTINNFKSDSDAFDTSGVINAIKEENNVLEQNTQKVKENTQAKEQNTNVNFSKYDKHLDSYNGKIDKYKTTIDRFNDGGWTSSTYLENVQAVKNAVKEYETLLNELKGKDASLVTSDDINRLDNYEKKIKDTIATVTNMSAAEKGYNFVSAQKELDKIHKLINENSKMSSEAKNKIRAYYAEIESGNPSMSLDRIHGEIMKIYNAEVEAGRAGRTLWDTLKNSGFHQIAAQMAGMVGVYDVINLGKQAFSTIKELDYALVDLKKTTAMNSSELEQFYYDSNDVAKQMGVTTKEIIDQASSWSRLGYNSKQAATEMAKLSSQFALISPGMDTTTSQEGLVSIMKAWDIGYQDVKSQIMDDINALGNAMAEDNQDIVEGMERSAAALAAVGTSTKDAFALFSGIQEVLQNSEKSGTSLRSVALRLRSFDETTGEYSEDLANITGELADLTKTAEHAQGVSVFKPGSTTEFKSLVDYFREIADIWDEMSQKQQNDFLLKAFGRTQAQAGAALIQNFKGVEKALDVMDNAAGSADKEMETAKQSITYKLNELKQTWVGTVQDIANRKDLSLVMSSLIGISKGLGFIIGKLGLIPSVITPIAAILGKGKSTQRFCPIW